MNAKEALKVYFGYDSYKPGQEELIEAVLSGRDALGIMPTGAGKSVCYQVLALRGEQYTLILYPEAVQREIVEHFIRPGEPSVSRKE